MDKLNSLPVPDIENIIWQRIDSMLDAIPGTMENPQFHTYKTYKGFSRQLAVAIFAVIIAVVCIVVLKKKHGNSRKELRVPAGKIQSHARDSLVKTVPYNNAGNTERSKNIQVNKQKVPATDKKNRTYTYPDNQNSKLLIKDSSVNVMLPRVFNKAPDTIINFKKDSIGGFKKPRGVKGVTDSDYRMVPLQKY